MAQYGGYVGWGSWPVLHQYLKEEHRLIYPFQHFARSLFTSSSLISESAKHFQTPVPRSAMRLSTALPLFLTLLTSPLVSAHPFDPTIYPKDTNSITARDAAPLDPQIYPKDTNSIIGRGSAPLDPQIYPKDTNSIIGRGSAPLDPQIYPKDTNSIIGRDNILPKAVDPVIYQASSNGISLIPSDP